jgi:hypothetical protein
VDVVKHRTKHRGSRVPSPQWWQHLRDWKRLFWKRERRAGKREMA